MSKTRIEECHKRVLNAKFSEAERQALEEIDYSLAEGTKQAVKFFVEYKRAEKQGAKEDRVIERIRVLESSLMKEIAKLQRSSNGIQGFK